MSGLVVSLVLAAALPAAPLASPPVQPAMADPAGEQTTPLPPRAAPSDVGPTITAAYEVAQNAQGPLDGRWKLSGGDGVGLFDFVLADPGGPMTADPASPVGATIEGAWRDIRRAGGLGASGPIERVTHEAGALEIRFRQAGSAATTVVTLRAGANGLWSGLLFEGGVSRSVAMARF